MEKLIKKGINESLTSLMTQHKKELRQKDFSYFGNTIYNEIEARKINKAFQDLMKVMYILKKQNYFKENNKLNDNRSHRLYQKPIFLELVKEAKKSIKELKPLFYFLENSGANKILTNFLLTNIFIPIPKDRAIQLPVELKTATHSIRGLTKTDIESLKSQVNKIMTPSEMRNDLNDVFDKSLGDESFWHVISQDEWMAAQGGIGSIGGGGNGGGGMGGDLSGVICKGVSNSILEGIDFIDDFLDFLVFSYENFDFENLVGVNFTKADANTSNNKQSVRKTGWGMILFGVLLGIAGAIVGGPAGAAIGIAAVTSEAAGGALVYGSDFMGGGTKPGVMPFVDP